MKENITINGEDYIFCDDIGNDTLLCESFNELAKKTFWLQFDKVGGEYEPHVIIKDNKVISNISVNQIYFTDHGMDKFYIQLGTVMTDEIYRGQGLSRYIIEWIIKKWRNNCDCMYLFANDSVLDFYPKFGFEESEEYICSHDSLLISKSQVIKLNMDDLQNVKLANDKYLEGNPFAAFEYKNNMTIYEFYRGGVYKDNVFYLPDYGVIIFAEYMDGTVLLLDIFGQTDCRLIDIIASIKHNCNDKVILGFSPLDEDNLVKEKYKEEDCTLFILCGTEDRFKKYKERFPALSHA